MSKLQRLKKIGLVIVRNLANAKRKKNCSKVIWKRFSYVLTKFFLFDDQGFFIVSVTQECANDFRHGLKCKMICAIDVFFLMLNVQFDRFQSCKRARFVLDNRFL